MRFEGIGDDAAGAPPPGAARTRRVYGPQVFVLQHAAVQPDVTYDDIGTAGQHDALSRSVVVTSCVAVLVLPIASRAVQTTVVVPRRNVAGALFVMVTAPPSSLAVAAPIDNPAAAVHFVDWTAGGTKVNVGATVSPTTTCRLCTLPATSWLQNSTQLEPPLSDNGARLRPTT
jgi:hypothetical protein